MTVVTGGGVVVVVDDGVEGLSEPQAAKATTSPRNPSHRIEQIIDILAFKRPPRAARGAETMSQAT
jgi:hypothetical protein